MVVSWYLSEGTEDSLNQASPSETTFRPRKLFSIQYSVFPLIG